MELLAPDLHLIPSRPAYSFNAYLMEGVLVDAATRGAYGRLRKALNGTRPSAHAITHAHADHQGASAALCEALGIELWAGEADADAMASGDLSDRAPSNMITRWQLRHWAGPAHPGRAAAS